VKKKKKNNEKEKYLKCINIDFNSTFSHRTVFFIYIIDVQ